MLKTIYGHPVKNLASAKIVSSSEAARLLAIAIEQDKVRAKFELPLIVHPDLKKQVDN